jgi:hypothetical protein
MPLETFVSIKPFNVPQSNSKPYKNFESIKKETILSLNDSQETFVSIKPFDAS